MTSKQINALMSKADGDQCASEEYITRRKIETLVDIVEQLATEIEQIRQVLIAFANASNLKGRPA